MEIDWRSNVIRLPPSRVTTLAFLSEVQRQAINRWMIKSAFLVEETDRDSYSALHVLGGEVLRD